jgi:hypothetical protein
MHVSGPPSGSAQPLFTSRREILFETNVVEVHPASQVQLCEHRVSCLPLVSQHSPLWTRFRPPIALAMIRLISTSGHQLRRRA